MEGGYRFVAPLGGGIGLTPYGAAFSNVTRSYAGKGVVRYAW